MVSRGLLRKYQRTKRPYEIFSLQEFGIKVEGQNPKRDQQNEENIN